MAVTFSAEAKIAAHQALADLIDAGSGNGYMLVYSAADVLLGEVPLDGPCGTVNGTTGQLTFDFTGPDTSANATGTISYVTFADSDDNVHITVDAAQGSSPVTNSAVFNTLSSVSGYPITVISATVG